MGFRLLTEHYLEFLSLKEDCTDSSESTLKNAILLEITCRGSIIKYLFLFLWKKGLIFHVNPLQIHMNWQGQNSDNVLFGLMLYFPVNSYGHVGTVSSPNHTFFLGKVD